MYNVNVSFPVNLFDMEEKEVALFFTILHKKTVLQSN